MNPVSIHVHIDELVLEGVAPGDRYRIADALQRELLQLLARPGVYSGFAQATPREHVDAGAFETPAENPTALGRHAARSLSAAVFAAEPNSTRSTTGTRGVVGNAPGPATPAGKASG